MTGQYQVPWELNQEFCQTFATPTGESAVGAHLAKLGRALILLRPNQGCVVSLLGSGEIRHKNVGSDGIHPNPLLSTIRVGCGIVKEGPWVVYQRSMYSNCVITVAQGELVCLGLILPFALPLRRDALPELIRYQR